LKGCVHGLTLVLLAGVLIACSEDADESAAGGQPGGRGGGKPEAALPVKTEPVVRGEVTSYVETHARLEAERWVEVVSRVQGLAARLQIEEGDRVREGQILLNLEKKELQLQLEQAKVATHQAQAMYDRSKALQERRMVSQQEYETARNQLENAEVALREVQLRLEYADVRAPIEGVVMQRSVEQGELVRTNQILFAIADIEPLQVRIRVPEKRMSQVQVGQEARITVDPVPDRVFPATVRMISPGVDPATGTVKVTLAVPTGGLNLVDARDAAAGARAAMRKGRVGERYLLGGPNWTFREWMSHVEDLSGVRGPFLSPSLGAALLLAGIARKVLPLVGGAFKLDDESIRMSALYWYCDSAKARDELGFVTRDPMETLRDTIDDLRRRNSELRAP